MANRATRLFSHSLPRIGIRSIQASMAPRRRSDRRHQTTAPTAAAAAGRSIHAKPRTRSPRPNRICVVSGSGRWCCCRSGLITGTT